MEYPTLNVKQKSRQMSDAFLGYNHNLRIGDSEFYDMKNMTSDYYPVLAPRKQRGEFASTGIIAASGLIAKERLCYVSGKDFMICTGDGIDKVEMDLNDEPKQLISMGAYVIIMPDRKWVNTIKNYLHPKLGVLWYECGDIDEEHTTEEDVEFTLCTLTGGDYNLEGIDSATAPTNPKNGQFWLDTSTTPNTLKKYSESQSMWVSIATTYVKIASKNIGKNLKKYDGVKISGITIEGAKSLNSAHVLWDCTDDYIVIIGMLDKVVTQEVADGKITISRKMPEMDFVVESNNRLWGCRYGKNEDGDIVNEIYTCKFGDFKNWNCQMQISTDSGTLSCGSDGPFTGAITHLGYPLFFKESCMHKVYGDLPTNFQLQTTVCRGVQKGSHNSLAIVNEILYYKSANAVCAYDGSLPVEMSTALGEVRYSDAVACAHGNKYYINMKSANDGAYHLFVYDTRKGMWHKEDNIQVTGLCSSQGILYAINGNDIIYIAGNDIKGSASGDREYEQKVPWMVETGLIGMSMPDMKYISKLVIRMSLEVGASVNISIQYDSIGNWEQVCQMTSTSLRSFSVPIRPRRCDHFRIRIEGEGDGRIYSITRTIEQGSDFS